MPTYEYRCKACGQEIEVVQSFTDDALTTCEACGGSLRKVFGNVGIAFKGNGFYKNDSRGKTSSTATSTSEKPASSESSSTSSDSGSSTTSSNGSSSGSSDGKSSSSGSSDASSTPTKTA